MKENNVIQQKSYAFAVRSVRLYQHLTSARREFVLSKQVLRSGTSIGANVEEAIGAHSRADFFARMTVAYKEARETRFWLRLLRDTGYLTSGEFDSLSPQVDELLRLLGAIQRTTRSRA